MTIGFYPLDPLFFHIIERVLVYPSQVWVHTETRLSRDPRSHTPLSVSLSSPRLVRTKSVCLSYLVNLQLYFTHDCVVVSYLRGVARPHSTYMK